MGRGKQGVGRLPRQYKKQDHADTDKGANGKDIHPQGKRLRRGFLFRHPRGRGRGGRRGRIPTGRAARRKGAVFPGKTAGWAAYRREKLAAMRTGFCVRLNFVAAIVAKKTGAFTHSLRGLGGRFCGAAPGSVGGAADSGIFAGCRVCAWGGASCGGCTFGSR